MDDFIALDRELANLSDLLRQLQGNRFLGGPVRAAWRELQQNHLTNEVHPLPLSPRTLRAGPRRPPQPSWGLRTGALVDSLVDGYQPVPNGAVYGGVASPAYAGEVEKRLNLQFERSLVPPVESFANRVDAEIDRFLEGVL